MIGVDRDQNEDGKYTTKDGKDDNLTLASTIKGVNIAVKKISDLALEDKFWRRTFNLWIERWRC